MALARLGGGRRQDNYTWPGFVDVLATLLMVIMFVLLVFVLTQVNLAHRISGQNAELTDMREQIASLGELLNIERRANADLQTEITSLSGALEDSRRQRAKLTDRLAAARQNLALREAAIEGLESDLAEARESGRRSLAHIGALEAETAASRRQVETMTREVVALRERLDELRALLAEKEAQAERDKVTIANLGKSLNSALATRVQDLQQFRSEFFGRLREVLEGRDEVQIVGDRFVFQSEVLFDQGRADLGPEGRQQLATLAVALRQIADQIPRDINWILLVEGHTDNVPIRGERFADNWDLSTERALSVVRFLVNQGLDSERLAAAGYGEFQPLDGANTAEARRKNRRIEIKLTRRIADR